MWWGKHKRKAGFADLVDYHGMVDNDIHLLTSGAYLAAWKLRGPDMESLAIGDSGDMLARIADSFRLGAGWTVQSDQFQDVSVGYSAPDRWSNPIAELIDQERRQLFESSGSAARFESTRYLCVSFLPPREAGQKGVEWMFGEEGEGQASRDLETFRSKVADIDRVLRTELLRGQGTFVQRLGCQVDEFGREYNNLYRYVRRCLTGRDFPFASPSCPVFHNQLFTVDFVGGQRPIVNGEHLLVLPLIKFPDKAGRGSYPGIMGALEALPFQFRFVQQGACIPGQEAKTVHETNETRWSTAKTGVLGRGRVNSQAAALEFDSHQAAEAAEYGIEYYVRYDAKVILSDADPVALAGKAGIVKTIVEQLGFSCQVETRNATRAFIASLPGHAPLERRRFLATVDNLAQMAQLSAPYTGEETNPSKYLPGAIPLFWGCTLGRVPYRFHAHVNNQGAAHTVVIGPAGSGKTTLTGLLIAQHERIHPEAQTFVFDKDFTQYTLVRALGGDFYTLDSHSRLRFCPLQRVDLDGEGEWAATYIETLCSLNSHEPDAEERNAIYSILTTLTGLEDRSLTAFQSLIGPVAPGIAQALQLYTIGTAGGILDGTYDNLSLRRLAAFEMGSIYRMDARIASAVLFYVFHRIEERLTPERPTLITVDEFRQALDHPVAAQRVQHFLEQGRKLNGCCVTAIQETAKILKSALAQTITRECANKVFLPNSAAAGGESEAYSLLGATQQDIAYIAKGAPHHYYLQSPHCRRYITLELGDVAKAFMTHSTAEDRAEVDRLVRLDADEWQAHWLRGQGLPEWADEFVRLAGKQQKRRAYAVA